MAFPPFKRHSESPSSPEGAVVASAGSSAAVTGIRSRTLQADTPKKRVEVHAKVTVGAEHAAILSERLGRHVEVGEEFDLGLVAGFDPDPILNEELQSEAHRPHIFNDPLPSKE
jgi:hypothetical protein